MKLIATLITSSVLLLLPATAPSKEVTPTVQQEAKKVIEQAWKEATKGGWKYTNNDVNITKQVLVTLVKGVNFIDIEAHKPLHKEITKLPFVTYIGK
jgi:hypothetical protein